MIKVFNGKWRGLGVNDNGFGMILDFRFRSYLSEFKGARLAVFMAIALHSDENGLSYPSYDLLEKETGYSRATIASALDDLCSLVIDDQRVLMRYRERDERGQYTGSNHYIIFPTPAELSAEDNQSLVSPTVENPKGGESKLKDKPLVKDKPIIGASAPPPHTPRSAEEIKDGTLNALARGMNKELTYREQLEKAFRITPNWNTKTNQRFMQWLKSRPPGQTIEKFAAWWFSDWRGRDGSPPSVNQIQELWLQAFKPASPPPNRINPQEVY